MKESVNYIKFGQSLFCKIAHAKIRTSSNFKPEAVSAADSVYKTAADSYCAAGVQIEEELETNPALEEGAEQPESRQSRSMRQKIRSNPLMMT
jgi:hypothetical protein